MAELQYAEDVGRKLAHDRAVFALAEQAGQLMKEAGLFGRLGKAISSKLTRKASSPVVERVSLRSSRGAAPTLAPHASASPTASAPAGPSKGPGVLRRRGGVVTPLGQAAPTAQAAASAPAAQAAAKPSPRRGRVRSAQPSAQGAGPYRQPAPGAPAPQSVEEIAQSSAEAAAKNVPLGKVKSAPVQTAQGKVQQAPAQGQVQQAPAQTGTEAPAQAPQKKGWGVGKWVGATALGLGGLGVYGAVKTAPHVVRALESASNTPMAPSMGWSPVPYGYGYNPYGSGVPTMGYGG